MTAVDTTLVDQMQHTQLHSHIVAQPNLLMISSAITRTQPNRVMILVQAWRIA